MKTFYLTFGVQYPWKDGWVEVMAHDYQDARKKVISRFGTEWSALYKAEEFEPHYFVKGKLETMK